MESSSPSLADQIDAAQSILGSANALQAKLIEQALAETSRCIVEAMAKMDPTQGAKALRVAGGIALFAGDGSPITQALALGFDGPVSSEQLDQVERHLCPSGSGRKQLEVCPYADPSLPTLLAARGYRVNEWQLVWIREVPSEPMPSPPAHLAIRKVGAGEEDLFCRTLLAGFMESEDVPEDAIRLMRPLADAEGHELLMAWMGEEPIGAATLAWANGVMFGGTGVRPAFRRRGTQQALIAARLNRARTLGCTLACSNTLPGTSSRRNMERLGYRVAYPKIAMLR
jgi:GNAT superfamily N-acetyltransferase